MAEEGSQAQPPPGAPPERRDGKTTGMEFYAKALVVLFFMGLLCLLLVQPPWALEPGEDAQNQTASELAESMFEVHGAGLVLISIVMGAGILGGLFLAREDGEDGEMEGREGATGKPPSSSGGGGGPDSPGAEGRAQGEKEAQTEGGQREPRAEAEAHTPPEEQGRGGGAP